MVGCFRKAEFNRDNLEENMGHSWSDKYLKFPPRDSEISGDQDVWENSNEEGSKITSDRLDSDLVLGRYSSNYSTHCSIISLMDITPPAGKEKVMPNLYILLAFRIRLLGSKIS